MWEVIFFLLLVPLLIVEIIIFLKSRKFFWLVYALSIFTYIVAVSYTIDVFDLGRNAILLTLLASAVVMFLIGRQLGKKVKKQRTLPRTERNIAITLASLMILVFVISVIFGRAQDQVTPVASLNEEDLVVYYEENDPIAKPYEQTDNVAILKRTVTNNFILPVPVVQTQYRTCLQTAAGNRELGYHSFYEQNQEVSPGETKTVDVLVSPVYWTERQRTDVQAVLVYEMESQDYSWAPCESLTLEPTYRIPVQ